VCSQCAEQWEETGTGQGFGKALAHSNRRNAGHKILGLVDLETGDILVEGLSRPQAEQKGYIVRTTPSGSGTAKPPKDDRLTTTPSVGERDGLGASARTTKEPTMTGVVKGLQIEFPYYLATYAAMGMARFLDPETGQPYPFSAEGMAKYLTDFIREGHRRLLPVMLGLSHEELALGAVQQKLQALQAAIEGEQDPAAAALAAQRLYQQGLAG
jgi:hypothetical protein